MIALTILVVWGCSSLDPIAPDAVNYGRANFARFHVMGDNLTAGMQNAGLVEGFQKATWGPVVAQSARLSQFAFPNISENGIPPTMYASDFDPVTIDQLGEVGSPTNLTYAGFYNNMGIPGATLHQLLVKRPDPGTDTNPFFGIVLRDSTAFGGAATAVAQAVAAQPTLLVVWAGYTDYIASASAGTDALLTPAASFEADYRAMIGAVSGTAGAIVTADLPDITDIPFFTTIPPVVINPDTGEPVPGQGGQPIPLIGYVQGTPGPLPPGSLVTLSAADSLKQGVGIPTMVGGTGRPLPDWAVVDPTERGNIVARVGAFNAVIDSVGENRSIPVVDMSALFHRMVTTGYTMRGDTYTSAFLQSSLFGVDGLHPNSIGYYVIALEFIKVVNQSFGAALPQPTLPLGLFRNPALGATSSTAAVSAAATISTEEWRDLWRLFGVHEAFGW
jgi:hypothetical protein